MLAARVILLIWPFARIAARLGDLVAPEDPRASARPPLDARSVRTAREIGWAVRATAPFMPFRSLCLQQAMAARAMLRRRNIACVIHFGAGRGETNLLDAHAWLDASGIRITGYPVAANITEIGCLV